MKFSITSTGVACSRLQHIGKRHLQRTGVEGKPYQLVCVLTAREDEPKYPWIFRFPSDFACLHLGLAEGSLKKIAEVAQGAEVAIWISSPSLRVLGITRLQSGAEKPKRTIYERIVQETNSLVFDIQGNRTVEFYGLRGTGSLRDRHDGFEWREFPPVEVRS